LSQSGFGNIEPMVERTIAWRSHHNRKVHYRGVTKTITGCIIAPPH
jgi:hypothetical protein